MAKKKAKVKKKFTNLIIIDASGSMGSKIAEVVGGIKQLFKDIKRDATKNPEVESTTIVVDFSGAGDYRELINSTDPNALLDSVAEAYTTRGLTALYDAIGFGFGKIPADQDGVFINILTDGEENDSKEMKSDDVRKLIESGKKKNWVITFMGTTEECLEKAISLGVSRGNSMKFADSIAGTAKAMHVNNLSRTAYYTSTVSVSTGSAAFDLENVVKNVLEEEK